MDPAVLVDVRLTFVAIADDELGVVACLAPTFPFDPGRESGAAPTTQVGGGHLGNHLLRAHLEEGLEVTGIGAAGDRFLDRVRIDDADVLHHNSLLVLVEGVTGERLDAVERLVAIDAYRLLLQPALDYVRDFIGSHVGVVDERSSGSLDRNLNFHPVCAVDTRLADDHAGLHQGVLGGGIEHSFRALGDRRTAHTDCDDRVRCRPERIPFVGGSCGELLEVAAGVQSGKGRIGLDVHISGVSIPRHWRWLAAGPG
jgi:hypothetical protein